LTNILSRANSKYKYDNLSFIRAECTEIPLSSDSIDLVFFETLEHVVHHTRFLNEISRVLKLGGVLVISTPTGYRKRDERCSKSLQFEEAGPDGIQIAAKEAFQIGSTPHVVLDNYVTHKHPKVLAWLARHPRWTFHSTQPLHSGSMRWRTSSPR
jgi:ubiquinone/menaquinone biosynthesis C-methylase UbiE